MYLKTFQNKKLYASYDSTTGRCDVAESLTSHGWKGVRPELGYRRLHLRRCIFTGRQKKELTKNGKQRTGKVYWRTGEEVKRREDHLKTRIFNRWEEGCEWSLWWFSRLPCKVLRFTCWQNYTTIFMYSLSESLPNFILFFRLHSRYNHLWKNPSMTVTRTQFRKHFIYSNKRILIPRHPLCVFIPWNDFTLSLHVSSP